MRSYRPSGAVPGGAFFRLLIIAILSGLILGAILWAVDNYIHFYLVLLFPLVGGGIAGGALAAGVRGGKVRSPLVAGLMGLLAGLIMFGVYHGANYYVTFRSQLRDLIVERTNQTPTDEDLNALEGLLYQDSNIQETGFIGYLKFAADAGFTITSTGSTSSSSPMEIKGTIAFVYWGIEILLACLIAAGLAWSAAKEPFDENTNQWYGPPMVLAQGTTKSRKALIRALKDGSFREAGALLTKQPLKYPHIEVWVRRSPDSAAEDVLLMIKHLQRPGRPSNIKSGMISANELSTMMQAVDAAVDANPVVSKA